jgi:phage terminase large subunit-like protein
MGSREPLYRLAPAEVVGSLGSEAADLARRAGYELDEWQFDTLVDGMGTMEDGHWAADTVLCLASRQNGKSLAGVVRAAYGAAIRGERVVWTAHQFKAAREAFRMLVRLVDSEAFRAFDPRVLRSSGQEAVEFASGGRVDFVARSGWSGRGFAIDLLVLDESFALDDDMLAALLPSLTASKHGQVWYLSSAPHESSVVLRRLAVAGRAGELERTVYREHVAPDDLAASDIKAWQYANPSLGTRIELRKLADDLEKMDEEDFAREHLGRWAPEALGQVFDKATWASLAMENPPPADGPIAFGIDVPPARDASCVAMAQKLGDGSVLVEIVAVDRGATWIVDVAATLAANRPVIVDGAGWARELIEPLRGKGVDVRVTDVGTMAAACAGFFDAYVEGRLRHRNDPILTAAAEAAEKRTVGEARWAWARRTAKGNIAALVATTLAHYGTTLELEQLWYVALPNADGKYEAVI